MNTRKIILAGALLLSATSAAMAQSAWTTGSAADRQSAGYASPYGGNLYAYAPDFAPDRSSGLGAYAMVPRTRPESIDDPALTGGGSIGYNEMVRRAW